MYRTKNAVSVSYLAFLVQLPASSDKMGSRPCSISSKRCISAIAHGFSLAARMRIGSTSAWGIPIRFASDSMFRVTSWLAARSVTVSTHRRTSASDSLQTASPYMMCVSLRT